MNFNKLTIGILGIGVNRIFSYWRYFSMAPFGAEGIKALSKGFFDVAAAQTPRPKTAAILAGDATLTVALAASARDSASEDDFNVIYDERYALTADFAQVMPTLKQANADVVFLAADETHTVGMMRAVRAAALAPNVLGGAMSGLLDARVKAELGPSLDGIIAAQNLVPAPTLNFPGLGALMQRYRAAAERQADPLGYSYVPFGYAAGQVLAQAVKDTNSLDPDQLAAYIHGHRFATVVGEIAYDENGEWSTPRPVFTQFQNVAEGDVGQFSDTKVQPIVWPPQYRTADVVYPYRAATKK
jgi:branched-chain amino acid transport system substrate-binding protein